MSSSPHNKDRDLGNSFLLCVVVLIIRTASMIAVLIKRTRPWSQFVTMIAILIIRIVIMNTATSKFSQSRNHSCRALRS